LILVWNSHLIHWIAISVILSLKINELQNTLLGISIILLLYVCLGSPEINFDWSSES
jgi:hypothetical protein